MALAWGIQDLVAAFWGESHSSCVFQHNSTHDIIKSTFEIVPARLHLYWLACWVYFIFDDWTPVSARYSFLIFVVGILHSLILYLINVLCLIKHEASNCRVSCDVIFQMPLVCHKDPGELITWHPPVGNFAAVKGPQTTALAGQRLSSKPLTRSQTLSCDCSRMR